MGKTIDKMVLESGSRVVAGGWGCATVEQLILACRNETGLVALESLMGHEAYGQYSIVSFDPVRLLHCTAAEPRDPFDSLEDIVGRYSVENADSAVPLAGGWIGYLAYEAGRFLERLPAQADRDLDLPYAWFGLFNTVAVFDHHRGEWHVAGVEFPPSLAGERPGLADRLDRLESLIRAAAELSPPQLRISPAVDHDLHKNRGRYIEGVGRILDYIRAGDIYQANLTTRFDIPVFNSSIDLYRSLRHNNPADYMAYLDCGDHQVLCSSPELFLSVAGREVLTRPIKGTRPRSANLAEDLLRQSELLASEKDLAELAMIVDLERNDLGRVCVDVRTDWPPSVETYATVHHLVADVRGRLGEPLADPDGWSPEAKSVIDVLRATFPGGSITGAPKIRAMEIIDQLEPVARGPYCGAIGHIGLDGRMAFNVAIRTMVAKAGRAHVHAGSGIVADSEPDAEYAETLAKAQGMLAALGARAGSSKP